MKMTMKVKKNKFLILAFCGATATTSAWRCVQSQECWDWFMIYSPIQICYCSLAIATDTEVLLHL